MADNIDIKDAAGVSRGVATDEIGSASYQRIKVTDGLAESETHLRVTASPPSADAAGAVVRQAPIDAFVCSFAAVGSSLVTTDLTQRRLGTGVGVTQGSGNLLVTTGTSTNQEFLARSVRSFNGATIVRAQSILSQRIANQNFAVLMADLIGEGLSCTINGATSISVTLTGHGLTAQNVGQFMFVGAISGAAGVPGRYAIASIPDANTINFTVAGWPGSGSCTLDLFGWNHYKILYSGTTATQTTFDAQRRGWATGDSTLTINTTASPGHMVSIANDGRNAYVADALVASTTTPTLTTRGSRYTNLPDPDVELYLYLWAYNGTSAPASTTTWTVGFVSVEDTTNNVVYLGGVRPQGAAAPMPVTVIGTATVSASGTVTANQGTLATPTASIVNSAATTNGTVVKGSAGTVYSVTASNINAAIRYVKLYNSTTVTVGTTTPAITLAVPAGGFVNVQFGTTGMRFGTGICLGITTGATDADTGAVAANEIKVLTAYI